jgi:hypothetical protein
VGPAAVAALLLPPPAGPLPARSPPAPAAAPAPLPRHTALPTAGRHRRSLHMETGAPSLGLFEEGDTERGRSCLEYDQDQQAGRVGSGRVGSGRVEPGRDGPDAAQSTWDNVQKKEAVKKFDPWIWPLRLIFRFFLVTLTLCAEGDWSDWIMSADE